MLSSLARFFGAVDGSIRGFINVEELWKAVATAPVVGAAASLIILALGSIVDHSSAIFPNPSAAGAAVSFVTLVLDLIRRQSHGSDPKNAA